MMFFSFEVIASAKFKKGYWLSFFFWLDLISTISLLFDITFIFGNLLANSGGT